MAVAAAGLVNCLPLWLAPNLITLVGLIGMFVAYGIGCYYDPDFDGGCQGGRGDWYRVLLRPRL